MEFTSAMDDMLKKLSGKNRKAASTRNRLKRHFAGEAVKLTKLDKEIISKFEKKK